MLFIRDELGKAAEKGAQVSMYVFYCANIPNGWLGIGKMVLDK